MKLLKMDQTKRDLQKLSIISSDQLEHALPKGIRCEVQVVIQRDDNGIERNRIRSFRVVGTAEPQADVFAPDESRTDDPRGPNNSGLDVSDLV